MNTLLSAIASAAFLLPAAALAQNAPDDWEASLRAFDTRYWQAFNSCKVEQMTEMNTDDLEFYHDLGGPMNGKPSFAAATAQNICGVAGRTVRREAVAGTIKFYPMRNNGTLYGAVISGEHNFFNTEQGVPQQAGHALFTHFVQWKDGQWKVARVLSYAHGPAR